MAEAKKTAGYVVGGAVVLVFIILRFAMRSSQMDMRLSDAERNEKINEYSWKYNLETSPDSVLVYQQYANSHWNITMQINQALVFYDTYKQHPSLSLVKQDSIKIVLQYLHRPTGTLNKEYYLWIKKDENGNWQEPLPKVNSLRNMMVQSQ